MATVLARSWQMKWVGVLCFVCLVFSGCTAQNETVPLSTVTRTPPATEGTAVTQMTSAPETAVPEDTATTPPTWTPTPTVPPTETAVPHTPTATTTLPPQPTATKTPRPSPTPTSTLAPQIDLPDWIRDPEIDVLLANTYEIEGPVVGKFSFINAQTGEQFDLRQAPRFGRIAWGEDEQGLFFEMVQFSGSHSDGFHDRVYIDGGETVRLPLSPFPSEPEQLMVDNGAGVTATIDQNSTGKPAYLTTEEGTSQLLNDPFNGRYAEHATLSWSADGTHLLVHRQQSFADADTLSDSLIYDQTGQLIATYENAATPAWSPTNSQLLLYVDQINGDKPCLTDVVTGQIDCDGWTLWREENSAQPAGYRWMNDGRAIGFTYQGVDDNRYGFCLFQLDTHNILCPYQDDQAFWRVIRIVPTREENNLLLHLYYNESEVKRGIKAICLYDGESGNLSCPMDNEPLIDEAYIHFNNSTENGRFVALVLHDGCPGCDDRSHAMLALVDMDANTVTHYGFVEYARQAVSWRPTIE